MSNSKIYLFVPVCADGQDWELWKAARHILATNGVLDDWDEEVREDGFFLCETAVAYKAAGALRNAGFEASYLEP